VGVSGYYERYRFVYLPFRFEDAGGSLDLWRDLTRNLKVLGNYTYRGITISDSGSAADDQSATDPYLTTGLDYDSRDLRYYPSHGVHATALATFGALGSDKLSSYSYFDLSLAGYQAVPYLGILASRVSYRGTSDSLPVYERSYLGGPGNIRGVDFSSVRGDENFLATIELRRPIFLVPLREGRAVGLGFHAFIDWGTAWEAAQSLSDANMRHSGGVGLHLNLNTYNLRFEWAFSDHDGNSFIFADRFTF
jgi:outer membrane protein assembly factor BamA